MSHGCLHPCGRETHHSPLMAALWSQRANWCATPLMPAFPAGHGELHTLGPGSSGLGNSFRCPTRAPYFSSSWHQAPAWFGNLGASGEASPDPGGCGGGQAGRRQNTPGPSVAVPWLCPPVLRDPWRGDRHKSPGLQSSLHPLWDPGPTTPRGTL